MKESVLVIAAHPDDEILGCGATIAKHINQGNEVNLLIMVEGATSRNKQRNPEDCKNQLETLNSESKKASAILGANLLDLINLPDNRLDSLDLIDIVKLIEEQINAFKPSIIYTHHFGDMNIDHEIINRAVLTAARPKPNNKIKKIFSFEVLSSTEWNPTSKNHQFMPNWYEEISQFLPKKLEAAKAYKSEMCNWPHPRSIQSIKNLALMRGSQVGVEAAEAFCLLRSIN